jgi:hypothetical protein
MHSSPFPAFAQPSVQQTTTADGSTLVAEPQALQAPFMPVVATAMGSGPAGNHTQGTVQPQNATVTAPQRRSKFSSGPPPGISQLPGPSLVPMPMREAAPVQQRTGMPPGLPGAAQAQAHVVQAMGAPETGSALNIQPAAGPQVLPLMAHAGAEQSHAMHGAPPPLAPSTQPPPFTEAPSDEALALRISKLAEFVVRNGPAFEHQVRNKQGANPEYAFLNGGAGSGYYHWCLFCTQQQLPLDQPLSEAWKEAELDIAAMPEVVSGGFAQVLQMLHATQVYFRLLSLSCVMHQQLVNFVVLPGS